jgi:multicomponent Na+:H+ antiporter subunit D
VVAGLSLIGVPGTAGFVTKWYLIAGALERGAWSVVAAIVLSSLIAVAYVWRVVEAAYLRPGQGAATRLEAPPGMLAAGLAMAALCLYFGLFTSVNVAGARAAAAVLMQGAP